MSQVADSPALEVGRSKERQEGSQDATQVADSPAPEAGRSSLFQDSLSLKAGQSGCCQRVLRHESGVADDSTFETGQSIKRVL
jgi:hypothetical protein